MHDTRSRPMYEDRRPFSDYGDHAVTGHENPVSPYGDAIVARDQHTTRETYEVDW